VSWVRVAVLYDTSICVAKSYKFEMRAIARCGLAIFKDALAVAATKNQSNHACILDIAGCIEYSA
jgi:hypothetical protein